MTIAEIRCLSHHTEVPVTEHHSRWSLHSSAVTATRFNFNFQSPYSSTYNATHIFLTRIKANKSTGPHKMCVREKWTVFHWEMGGSELFVSAFYSRVITVTTTTTCVQGSGQTESLLQADCRGCEITHCSFLSAVVISLQLVFHGCVLSHN